MPLKLERTPMREQDPAQRRRNFDEVALGYSPDEAMKEAQRCIQCKRPLCVDGCPVHVQIPQFIKLITEGRFEDAAQKIKETNNLPAVCGRVCPQEEQCEAQCVLNRKGQSVAIGRLERFAADYQMERGIPAPEQPIKTDKKVAVIGSGPAGLTAAADLAKLGYDVTVFESFHELGGVLVYGIPEFRLPKALVKQEIESLKRLGVNFVTNVIAGNTLTIDDLFDDGYQAVFIGTGAGLPKFMDIPGESLNGVYSANEYLTRVNLMKAYLFPKADTPIKKAHKVAVVGGGNVAMDAARCALRLGADEVHIVYRRSEAEMPARAEEVHHAKEEGIIFDLLTNPIRIIGENGRVTGMECIKMELGEPDASGRRRPMPVKGSEFIMEVDAVIMALGTTPNPLIASTTHGLDIQPWGGIIADEATGATSRPGVYAGGDAVTGAATVILAMGAGKKAAAAIHEYLGGKK
ncbi:NADPH-dependent glutamate synthase [Mahella sp.]|uniref:NADPH-dependent glutamate synthase n=1 Tax=Mahella sp. TaxID=2798721 RepID=UPI0025BA4A54|nr:NADPH-dependent glutamate synthase [Mahella sp.]MBZ4665551.1 sulfide dehydrogenase (flavoprotein) subunit SudA [Mahella sp.]